MLKTNKDKLVCQSVVGEITSPLGGINPYRVSPDGTAAIYPGVGGITYNLRIGEMAGGLFADHVEPGVSISNFTKFAGQDGPNRALNLFSCAGNIAKVISGEALGKTGRVTGKHGGIEHVLMDFDQAVLEKLAIGDRIMVRAIGTGLRLEDHDDVAVMNLDPGLLDKMKVREVKGKIEVGVTHVIPAALMGSGIGKTHSHSGDYDIQLLDAKSVARHGLGDIRLGDIVAIKDADNTFGRMYRKGAMTIGVVVHSDCVISGHGPGVTTIMSNSRGKIVSRHDPRANIARILRIGSHRKARKGAKK